jgi:hypothetical protein
VLISGISFQHCLNPNLNGGAVSAVGSSIAVFSCSFVNCSAASGGAIAVMSSSGPLHGSSLVVTNSSFIGNSAKGGLSGCPSDTTQSHMPCSTWGGAVAAFDILNVTVSGCKMHSNSARAVVPDLFLHKSASRNAVSGGGCVSLLFYGNTSGSVVHFTENTFEQCTVEVSSDANVFVGNGMFCLMAAVRSSRAQCLILSRLRRRLVYLLWPVGCIATS